MSLFDIDFLPEVTSEELPLVAEEETTQVTQETPMVRQEVSIKPVSSSGASHLLRGEWTWREMRDYVMGEIEKYHGPQVRNPLKEKGVFDSFIKRWGSDQSKLIAQAAFDIHHGMWANAPISLNRFCRSSDEYFAAKIIDKLSE